MTSKIEITCQSKEHPLCVFITDWAHPETNTKEILHYGEGRIYHIWGTKSIEVTELLYEDDPSADKDDTDDELFFKQYNFSF